MIIIYSSKEGIPVYYDKETDQILYKNTIVPYSKLLDAYNSGMSRVKLTDTLTFHNSGSFCDFGCIKIPVYNVELLIKLVSKLKIKNQKDEHNYKSAAKLGS